MDIKKRMLAKMYLLSFNFDSCQEIDLIRHALNLGMLKYLPTFHRTLISGDFKLFPVQIASSTIQMDLIQVGFR